MDPLTVTCGVLTLLTAAIASGKSLYNTIKSFQSHNRKIVELCRELEALIKVLESLKDVAEDENPILSLLKLPVLCCLETCQEFELVIRKCSEHSGGPRTSVRDWTKIKFMGGDIREFKDMLSGYKSTITIALGSLNLYVTRDLFIQCRPF